MNTVVCLKWGDKYGPEYVNNLHQHVEENLTLPHRFVCITDDPSGLADGIEALPLLSDDETIKGWWQKLAFFKKEIHDIKGRVLYIDLDVLITNNIDCFFEEEGGYIVIDEWITNGINSSVFRFEVGQHEIIWDEFLNGRPDGMGNPAKRERLMHGDQNWVCHMIPDAQTWPKGWCKSFKYDQLDGRNEPSEDTKMVIFHGHPKPEEAIAGFHKWAPTPWVADLWLKPRDIIPVESTHFSEIMNAEKMISEERTLKKLKKKKDKEQRLRKKRKQRV